MTFGILGSGSWGTALAKILTDNGNAIYWWNRNEATISQIKNRRHNPHYLSAAYFDVSKLTLTTNASEVIANSDCIVMAVPSAYIADILKGLDKNIFKGKKIINAIKGIVPDKNVLLNDVLQQEFDVELKNYFAVLGPCHAEEIAAEKLSYLTFSGVDVETTHEIAMRFKNEYLNTVENHDIYGVQYAAVLKNIYAIGAGIAHGLDYGDNFLSVLIANSADEMAVFLRKVGIQNIQVGSIEHGQHRIVNLEHYTTNYAASVYLGDLLVTCYSLYSRNRTFGNMVGKGYSVKSAQLEMNMVAEGYNASKCMYLINQKIKAEMPIAETVYKILWEQLSAEEGFKFIETELV
ncbi:NAD(P)H-dependent glycerol-3-phosphate dehydrogenase [Ferruginibacter albus]|uniref:NAD(P)H-dependent glycerol-3-phosphate dehydrogenase n=1 Tax=Ferruginibacter albus TaxID=2875540 RepID=UPI001CC59E14|nr:NAD(P)H-dependent glycerol-3-phosphate dehydrogenase [Ferruginibacter albus]UAY51711.1 NAD(P)-binding domain-containing protein [Ferruginibacter albus]